eukprot:8234150-Pyramimonas_sp.AAC.1
MTRAGGQRMARSAPYVGWHGLRLKRSCWWGFAQRENASSRHVRDADVTPRGGWSRTRGYDPLVRRRPEEVRRALAQGGRTALHRRHSIPNIGSREVPARARAPPAIAIPAAPKRASVSRAAGKVAGRGVHRR